MAYRDNRRDGRFRRRRKKYCIFCADKNLEITYKDPGMLKKFITDRGKIMPRRITGVCAKCQRKLAVEIKKARYLAMLPFSSDHFK